MNPLAKHPVLQELPRELLNNPDRNAILLFLGKKRRTYYRLKIVMIIGFIVSITCDVLFGNVYIEGLQMLEKISDVLLLVSFPIGAFAFHRMENEYNLSENEIDIEIEKHKSQQKVPA